jgi:hypothetical protein
MGKRIEASPIDLTPAHSGAPPTREFATISLSVFHPDHNDKFSGEIVNGPQNASCAMCGRLRVGKKNLHVAGLVGAAMCSAFERGSRDRWP